MIETVCAKDGQLRGVLWCLFLIGMALGLAIRRGALIFVFEVCFLAMPGGQISVALIFETMGPPRLSGA